MPLGAICACPGMLWGDFYLLSRSLGGVCVLARAVATWLIDSRTFLPLTCFLKAVVWWLADMDSERVGGVVIIWFSCWVSDGDEDTSSDQDWILYTCLLELASPGRSPAPHRLLRTIQASRYDGKVKIWFCCVVCKFRFRWGFGSYSASGQQAVVFASSYWREMRWGSLQEFSLAFIWMCNQVTSHMYVTWKPCLF
jgi:hypothetical protein